MKHSELKTILDNFKNEIKNILKTKKQIFLHAKKREEKNEIRDLKNKIDNIL